MKSIIFMSILFFVSSNSFADHVLLSNKENRTLLDRQSISKREKSSKAYVVDNLRLSKIELNDLIAKAQTGDMWAANALGMYYDIAGKNFDKTVYWLRISAYRGNPIAQYNLGSVLQRDRTRTNYIEALRWLELAEQNGVSQARYPKQNALKWMNDDRNKAEVIRQP